MKPTTTSVTSNQKELYVRARDNPFFEGMRRGEAAAVNKGIISDFQAKYGNRNINRSVSDIGSRGSRNLTLSIGTITEEDNTNIPNKSSLQEDIVLEPIERSSSGKWSKTSSPLFIPSDLDSDNHEGNESPVISSLNAREVNEETLGLCARPNVVRSYSVSKSQTYLSDVNLPPSAALFYNGPSPQIVVVESCQSVHKLNMYLKSKRVEVNAGVPGRFLHAVIGPDISDVGSVAATIMYAFYLHETLKNNQFCTVPVINMKRADLDRHADVQWLLESCHIDLSNLMFIDEVDLFYYDLFGSLKLVLVYCDKIPTAQEALREAIVGVFNCIKPETSLSSVDSVTVQEDASCCTVIAEKYLNLLPEILAGKGFCRLLLAGILVDTGNLTNPICTSKDNYMATLLIGGAGRFGCNGLYEILKHKAPAGTTNRSFKSLPESDLKVRDILLKEFKKWTGPDRSIGMTSIGTSVAQFLAHDPTTVQEIINFRKTEELDVELVVSGYYDSQKKFKRELLVCAEIGVMKRMLLYLNSKTAELPLKDLHKPGRKDEMRVFEIDKVTSRKNIERLLEEYTGKLVISKFLTS